MSEDTVRDELARIIASKHTAAAVDAILAAGYVKAEPKWAEGLPNDGAHEYTSASDCDGSNVHRWKRRPTLTYDSGYFPWEAAE